MDVLVIITLLRLGAISVLPVSRPGMRCRMDLQSPTPPVYGTLQHNLNIPWESQGEKVSCRYMYRTNVTGAQDTCRLSQRAFKVYNNPQRQKF